MEGPTDRQVNPEIKNEKLEWVANDLSKNVTNGKKYAYLNC